MGEARRAVANLLLVILCAGPAACGSTQATTAPPMGTATPAPSLERVAARTLPADCGTPVSYVAMGDSTVYGVGASSPEKNYVSRLNAQLRTHYPHAGLMNLGVSGATSIDVARDQLPRAVALHPQLVTISVGPNDITGGFDAQHYERSMEAIFLALQHDTRAVTVMNLLPDMAVAPRFTAEEKVAVGRQAIAFNEILARLGRQYGVQIVDLYTPTQQEVPGHPELLASDRYHPSDAGYARWALLMWAGVVARIPPAC